MMGEFAYRGPDGQGAWSDDTPGIALGHRRLSIIDLAGGAQPMSALSHSSWITFNGEIYNYQSERTALEKQGTSFRTHSDTEVILALYEQYGPEAWSRLRGQFAFGLWDGKQKALWLVRDRIGEKPLAYSVYKDVVYFASEVKALLRSSFLPHALDDRALGAYFLTQHLSAPATLAKGMKRLAPGHALCATASGVTLKRYWTPKTQILLGPAQVNEAVDQFRHHFEEAVKLCLVSDVSVGTYLSGGLDSSAVTWAASTLQPEPLHSFAIFNEDGYASHPDWPHAQAAAERLRTQHHNVFFTLPKLMAQIPEFIEKTDEPFEGPTALVSMYLAKATRAHVKVVLTGNGGDELLGGYQFYYQQVYRRQRFWQWADRVLPSPLRKGLGNLLAIHPAASAIGLAHDMRRLESNRRYHDRWLQLIQPQAETTLRATLLESLAAHRVDEHANYFRRYLWDDLFIYHHHAITTMPDATGMACSLEARNPFLDYRLVEFLQGLDPQLLIRRGQPNKYLLVKAMEGRLPDPILHRSKEGFSGLRPGQITQWIRTEGRSLFRDHLLDSSLARDGFIPQKGLEALWNAFDKASTVSEATYFQIPLWSAALLELWYRRHFLNERSAA